MTNKPDCPECGKSDKVVKFGKGAFGGKQRYVCKRCPRTFYRPEDYENHEEKE